MLTRLPKKIITIAVPIMIAFFNILIIIYPTEMIEASKVGVSLWFNNVFPSLLPFIIGTNILSGLGVIHFIGVLLEPVMSMIFGVPGCGGFALITGMTSGYPMGAKTVSIMYEAGELTKTEAQRLLSFVNNSGPLFILGAVGVGMFHSAEVGYFIMFIHYTGAIINGILFKNYKKTDKKKHSYDKLLTRANHSLKSFRQKNNKPFGLILGDSVRNAMETITQVGGFIILFCVIVKTLQFTGVVTFTEKLFTPIISFLNINSQLYSGVFIGLFEITNGANILSEETISIAPVLLAAFIISFGGFSIHAQSVSFLSKTDVNVFVYMLSKLSHAIITVLIGFVVYPFFSFEENATIEASKIYSENVLDKFIFSSTFFLASLGVIFVTAVLLNAFVKPHSKRKFSQRS